MQRNKNERVRQAPSIEELRKMEDYKIAYEAPEYLFIGQSKDIQSYYLDYPGRILHPEARGDVWTLEKNMAFMAGAIEAHKNFLIVTPLSRIASHARKQLKQQMRIRNKLGYTSAEVLWLYDNGYTFVKDSKNNRFTWANAPQGRVEQQSAKIHMYGHIDNLDTIDSLTQVKRIYEIAGIQMPELPKKQYIAQCNPNPRTLWEENRTKRAQYDNNLVQDSEDASMKKSLI